MKVEQCIITKQPGGAFAITARVALACEFVEAPDGLFALVRLLESGAGLEIGAEITVPMAKLSEI
jgi:hypothetical protein